MKVTQQSEVRITWEMADVGGDLIRQFDPDFDVPEQLARQVFLAMTRQMLSGPAGDKRLPSRRRPPKRRNNRYNCKWRSAANSLFTLKLEDLMGREFSPPLDPGIAPLVECLIVHGVRTFESCEGGDGHAYPEPTVRFFGDEQEGQRALRVAQEAGFNVAELRKVWPLIDGRPVGPYLELTLTCPAD